VLLGRTKPLYHPRPVAERMGRVFVALEGDEPDLVFKIDITQDPTPDSFPGGEHFPNVVLHNRTRRNLQRLSRL